MAIPQDFIENCRELLNRPRRVVITNHVNPDGDAVGSSLALAAILQANGHRVKVLMPNNYPQNLKWLAGSDQVIFYEEQEMSARQVLGDAEVIFHLDYNGLARSGPMQEALASSNATKVVIDHHQEPEDWPDLLYSDVKMSSTSEMVFHFIKAMDWLGRLNRAIAEAIYTGIITDTGNFRFSSTSSSTHHAAAYLLEKGLEPAVVASRIYDQGSANRLALLATMLGQMEILPSGKAVLLHLSEQQLRQHKFQKGDSEGFVNYGLSIKGVEVSAFVVEKEGKVKLSFRSKTDFDVNRFARKHYDGGGHKNAAGAISEYNLPQTLENLKSQLEAEEELT